MSKHTPGPWTAQRVHGCKQIGPKLGPHRQSHISELACTSGLNDEAEDEANARLMAAAPELLESLKGMIGRFEEKAGERPHKFCGCTYCHANAAVAKAEGRTK